MREQKDARPRVGALTAPTPNNFWLTRICSGECSEAKIK
jgi:hypothetical protein